MLGSNLGKGFFSSPNRQDRLRGPPSLLFNGYRGSMKGIKWPGSDLDPSPTSNVEVKNRRSCMLISAPPICLNGMDSDVKVQKMNA